MAYYIMTESRNPRMLVSDKIFDDRTLSDFRSKVDEENQIQQRANAVLKMIDSLDAMITIEPFDVVSDQQGLHITFAGNLVIAYLINALLDGCEIKYADVRRNRNTDLNEIVIDTRNPDSGFNLSDNAEEYTINVFKRLISKAREKYQHLIKCPESALGYQVRRISISELRLEDL